MSENPPEISLETQKFSQHGPGSTANVYYDSWKVHQKWIEEVLSVFDNEQQRTSFLERYFKVQLNPPAPKS